MSCGGKRSEFCKPCLPPECLGGPGIAPIVEPKKELGETERTGGSTTQAFDTPNPFLGSVEFTGLTEMPEAEQYQQGPYVGMRDSKDPAAANPRYAYNLQNQYPLDPEINAGWEGRPGFDQAGSVLGSSGKRTFQLIHQFTQLDGTERTCAIVGSKLYVYDWSGDSWTDKSAGQSTTSETARCWAVTFADKLLVSDGVNVPWTWDGTTFTALTGAPVAYGPPTVYYAKVFFIDSTDRATTMWSEENDPETGYDTGGYNNAWTLGQTDQDPLTRLVGTNYALIVFRARSTTAISGEVTTNFISSGTRDGISSKIGTTSDPVFVGGDVFIRDADYRPWVLRVSNRSLEPLFSGIRETVSGFDTSNFDLEGSTYLADLNAVLLTVTISGDTYPEKTIVMDARNSEFVGMWEGYAMNAIGLVRDGDGFEVLMHGSSNGFAYKHGTASGSLWDDEANATDGGTTAIEHIVEASPMGYDARVAKNFTRITALLRAKSAVTVSIGHTTPRRTSTAVSITTTHSGTDWAEDKIEFGSKGYGRWIRPKITHDVVGEQFGFDGWVVEGVPVTDHVGIY